MSNNYILPVGSQTLYDGLYDYYEDKKEDKITYCIHEWKKYEGFTEKYEFCTKCDEKREITNE